MAATVESVAEKILDIFRHFKSAQGHVLLFPNYAGIIAEWTPPEKRLVPEAFGHLVSIGDLEVANKGRIPGYRLTAQGEAKIYP